MKKGKVIGIIFLFFLISCFNNLASQSNNSAELYKNASNNFHLLYEKNEFRKFEHNWINTIKQFEKIYNNHPTSIHAPKSLYNIGKLYRSLYRWNKKKAHLQSSTKYFKKINAEYQKNYLADDSLLNIALNYLETDKALAANYFNSVIKKYPKSSLAAEAKTHLAKIKLPPKVKKTNNAKVLFTGKSKIKKAQTTSALVKNLDYFTTSDWTRVILTLNKAVPYKYQALKKDTKNNKPPRFYIDLQNSVLPADFKKKIVSNNGIIKKLRIAQFNSKVTRLVIDLYTLTKIKVFDTSLKDENKIIIDILGKQQKAQLNAILDDLQKSSKKSSNINLQEAFGLKINRIVIDPGHGGKDPGAVGHKHYYEKHLVLKLSKMVKAKLAKQLPNTKILLTREKDVFIPLESRTAFANSKKGDLFISIHANSFKSSRANGIETYYLSLTNDRNILALAARENSSTLKNISDLQAILNDLINQTKVPESRKLANVVQKAMISELKPRYKTKDLGVKKAPFLVLIGAQMPSILIEVGFISNNKERLLLSQQKYLDKLTSGINKGIINYIKSVEEI